MGVFDTHKVHHALYRAILARDAVKGVENDIWRGFRKACGDIVAHIDACDLVTTAFQRLGDTFPAHQGDRPLGGPAARSEEHTAELQSLMRISYAVFCLKKQNIT